MEIAMTENIENEGLVKPATWADVLNSNLKKESTKCSTHSSPYSSSSPR